jgi:RimJ/RimL family protein N-acetyltransferase
MRPSATPDGTPGPAGPLDLPSPPLADPSLGIHLRPWGRSGEDATALAEAWRDPVLRAATGVPPHPSVSFARRWIAGEADRRARGLALDLVVSPLPPAGGPARSGTEGGGAVWGEVGLRAIDPTAGRAELGWWITAAQRRRGFASAAVDLIAGWALGPPLDLLQVWARIDRANEHAARVAARAGFTLLGHAGGIDVWARTAAIVAS